MNILFINAYSAKNRGDYAIVLSMHDYIKNIFPNANIEIMSSYHNENKEIYENDNLKSIDTIWNIQNKSFTKKYLEGITLFCKVLFTPSSKQFNKITNADLIISVGGGYLYSSSKGPLGIGFLNMLFHIWISKKFQKKVIGFPQSIGPINFKLDRIILKKVLKRIDLLISREEITTNYLIDNLHLGNVLEYPDIAFLLNGNNKAYPLKMNENEINIGITVLDWLFSDKSSNQNDLDDYIKKIKSSFSNINKNYSIKVHIFVQVDVSENDSDYGISKLLHQNLQEYDIKTDIIRFPKASNIKSIISTYGKMDIFIGSRMHSTIFALNANVPTIALAYQPKTTGTFSKIKLSNFSFNIKSFNDTDLTNTIIKIINNEYSFASVHKIRDGKILTDILKKVI